MTSSTGDGGAKITAAADSPDSLPSPLDAIGDMRSAARWTLAAAGAVGATLISGGPLVAAGKVRGVADTFLALIGLAVALGGVGVAIWFTGKVLVPRLVTPATVRESADLADLRRRVNKEPAEFFGVAASSIEELFAVQARLRENAVSLTKQAAASRDSGRRAQIQAQLHRVEENCGRTGRYVRYLLALGLAWLIRAELERSRKWTLAGGMLVIVGAVLFFSAASSNGPTYVPAPTQSPTASSAPSAAP